MATGHCIKEARKKAGMTQKELAKKLGIAYQTLAQWENNLRNPKMETLYRIAAALGVDWTELVPEEQRGQKVIDHIKRNLPGLEIDSDDKETLKKLLPKTTELDPLTDEETALKTLLNSIGYDLIKVNDKYFFTHDCGGSEISTGDLSELFSCAQSGLKVAAKTLALKLLQKSL